MIKILSVGAENKFFFLSPTSNVWVNLGQTDHVIDHDKTVGNQMAYVKIETDTRLTKRGDRGQSRGLGEDFCWCFKPQGQISE